MEGFLSLPPERNSILGRSPWKTRYVILGQSDSPCSECLARRPSSHRLYSAWKQSKKSCPCQTSEGSPSSPQRGTWISIYKHKSDADCTIRYPLSSVRTCVVEDITHRKLGPAQPTLILELEHLEPAGTPTGGGGSRRRSSQITTASCHSPKSRPRTLLFRSNDEHPEPSLLEWRDTILQSMSSQVSPSAVQFNPNFSFGRSKGFSISSTRPALPRLQQSYHSTTSGCPPSVLLSPTGSIGSIHSELSSTTNSDKKSFFSKVSDLPSPLVDSPVTPLATGSSLGQGPGSSYSQAFPASPSSQSPTLESEYQGAPKPRETILDRAFMMNYIPGSERVSTPGLSSIARFEALMQELDLKKAHTANDNNDNDNGDDEEVDPLDNPSATNATNTPTASSALPTTSQTTLGPSDATAPNSGSNPRSSSQSISDLPFRQSTPPTISAPTTTTTTSHLKQPSSRARSRPTSLAIPSRSSFQRISSERQQYQQQQQPSPHSPDRAFGADSRRSSQSVKRQSLSDFTRRVSSTGSVLLARSFTGDSSSGSPRSFAFSDHSDVEDESMFHSNKLSAMPRHSKCYLDGAPF